MSNEAEMMKKSKPPITPILRFPEFRKDSGWKNMTFGDITTKTDKRNNEGKSYPVFSISNKTGFTPQSEQFEGVDSEKRGYDITLYKLIGPKTFAYNPARINVGSIGYSGDLNNIIISSLYVCFKARPDIDDQFLLYFLGTNEFGKSVNNHVEGGIRSYLFYGNFARIGISIPLLKEQKKIAECLGSLDEVIAAEGQKLEVLKTHKKGLMQQLFPHPGQTQPRLRFPQFHDKGEWKTIVLGDIVSISKGKGIAKSDIVTNGTTPCIRYAELYTIYGEVITHIHSRTNAPVDALIMSQAGDVIIPASGETKEDIASCSCVMNAGVALGGDMNVLRSNVDGRFLSYYLSGVQRNELAKLSQGHTIAHLSPKQIFQLSISITEESTEQQRIADCLSSLDDQIATQAKKIESLKVHKHGLMQQLFPAPEEQ